MGFSIASSRNNSFENKENLRRTAQMILNKQGASAETTNEIIEKTIFSTTGFNKSNIDILNASYYISQNASLKDTLKYLNTKSNKKAKKHILGEIWDSKDEKSSLEYEGELKDFEIDLSLNNIFIAA